MKYGPGQASLEAMTGLCDDMCNVVMRAFWLLSEHDYGVDMSIIESRRTPEKQAQMVADGKSFTMDSDHLYEDPDGSGVLAVDIYPWIPGKGSSHDLMHYNVIAKRMFQAAQDEGVAMKWGGWFFVKQDGILKPFPDRPHFAKRRP